MTPQENDTQNAPIAAISIRDVERQTWKDFKKLAALHEMSLQDYLKVLVAKEMQRVQISN